MTPTRRDLAAVMLAAPLAWGLAGPARALPRVPLAICGGRGGADGASQGAFEAAIRDGADMLAAAFAPSKDGALLALPDLELSSFTDVAAQVAFAGRRRSLMIDGAPRVGWFPHDFTLAELRTLSRAPAGGRPRGAPAGHAILTFEDVVAIARAGSIRTARVVGVEATMIRPAAFAAMDLALEPRLAEAIRVAGYNFAAAAMIVASDEPGALRTIGELTRARRVLRLSSPAVDARSMSTMMPAALKSLRAVAEGVAAPPGLLLDLTAAKGAPATPLIADAHAAGLTVQAWTSGPEGFPPPPLRPGDARRLLIALFAAGVDAVEGAAAEPIVRARWDALPETRD